MVVYIVGAGPGDPGLLTLRAQAILQMADVCLYDRLVHPDTLRWLPAICQQIYVGKTPDASHRVPQDETQRLMIAAAKAGKTVVRLKGGDPFVFGRGAEEAEACVAEGIVFEVVPGLSSALAVPAYAGIPMTHRDAAGSFTVVTAHRRDDGQDPHPIRWSVLAQLETVVFMMGLERLEEISLQLQVHGRLPDTPVAVVAQGTFPIQTTVEGTLATIAAKVRGARIKSPCVIVVGDVVRYREKIQWFEKRPLFGKTIWVTRDAAHGSRMSEPLRALGANVVEVPVIQIKPLPISLTSLLPELRHFQWLLLTSRHAVTQFMRKLREAGADARALAGLKIAAVGPGTVEALREHGLVADVIPAGHYAAEGLLDVLPKSMRGQQVLFPKAKVTREVLINGLTERGAMVHVVELYETVCADVDLKPLFAQHPPDVVTFTASSIVECFVQLASRNGLGDQVFNGVSIGPITSETMSPYPQLKLVAEAKVASLDGVIEVIATLSSNHR